jgi:hypothetical protein
MLVTPSQSGIRVCCRTSHRFTGECLQQCHDLHIALTTFDAADVIPAEPSMGLPLFLRDAQLPAQLANTRPSPTGRSVATAETLATLHAIGPTIAVMLHFRRQNLECPLSRGTIRGRAYGSRAAVVALRGTPIRCRRGKTRSANPTMSSVSGCSASPPSSTLLSTTGAHGDTHGIYAPRKGMRRLPSTKTRPLEEAKRLMSGLA